MSIFATIRRRARRSSLSLKLAVFGAAVTATIVCVAFWALSVEVRANTRRSLTGELTRNQRALQALQARNGDHLLFAASLVSQSPPFQYSLKEYQLEANAGRVNDALVREIEEELRPLSRRLDADLLLVTDDSGRVFATAGDRAVRVARGTSIAALPAIRHVLDPRARADTGELAVLRLGHTHLEVAAYPLVQDGFTLGSLVVAQRLDSAFLSAARSTSNADVVLLAGSSVITASDPAFATAAVASSLADRGVDGRVSTVRFGNEEYVAAPVSLGDTQDGRTVRVWMLQPLTRAVAALMKPLRAVFLLYGAFAVLVAGLGAGLVARTVLRPVKRFVQYMRSGAATEQRQGRFDADAEAIEVRTLNDSFNQLMDSLAARRRDLEQRTAELAAANVVLTDEISERTRVERALRESEAQLRQSQKLEAIGTLAGGIAHDFNNLITVISGYTQLVLMRADKVSPVADDLRQVIEASDRAANLTHQLLAFSRKQVLQPTVLDLGDVVNGIAPMLRRIIGEHIELHIQGVESLARVRADRGQLEQVLLNLAVNARDAMPAGGTLTIATTNAGDADSRRVALIVRDTGVGMAPEIRERVFEPFFTTKEPGKGTGLGLSTVYGIVNQSGGDIAVESALGHGTTFTIMLPPVETIPCAERAAAPPEDVPSGHETILIVEDAEDVRILARRTLEERGYTVLVARNADEALEIAAVGPIDALLTDIVMPQTSGPQLVARYLAVRPLPVIIYMSGYADEALSQYHIDPHVVFLRKPFTPAQLARTIRDALDTASASPQRSTDTGSVGAAAD